MRQVLFFVGLHQPSDAHHFQHACISINRLRGRSKHVACCEVLVDSGAFTELSLHGTYRHGVDEYAQELHRLHTKEVVSIFGAVAQDYMCEPFMLAKTALSVVEHQRLTIERYDALVASLQRLFSGACPFPVLPVIQGYEPEEYARHVDMYGGRLAAGAWVGVGSVCKRNGDPDAVVEVLDAIHQRRPDLLLHGFGVKLTALTNPTVCDRLATADSMAWSYSARRKKRSANHWQEAAAFVERIAEAASRQT